MKNRKISKLSEVVENIKLNEANEANEPLNIEVDDLINNSAELKKEDSKTMKIVKAIGKALSKALKSYTCNKAGDLIDELLLGQFKDSMVDIYKKEKLDSMSEEDAQKTYAMLSKENSQFRQGEEYSKLDNRRDDNTSSEVNPETEKFFALWYSNKKDENIGKQISDLVAEIQQSAKETEDEQKKLAAKLKSMKVNVSDEDFANFGPMLAKAVADGNSTEEINKNLKKLKSEVKESCQIKINKLKRKALLTESKFLLTEDIKRKVFIKSLLETDEFKNVIATQLIKEGLITEGFWSKALAVAGGAAASAVVYKLLPDKVKQKVKDFSQKTVKFLTNKTLAGILSLGGLGLSAATGGWGATMVIRAMYAVERHGKQLSNAFERQFTRLANSKGVITAMEFGIKDQKDSKYAMRFYVKDMVWRVLNLNDQLKHPGKDYAKAIIEGPEGKKYRERLAQIWDPLFSKEKGGKIDFNELFKQAKNVKIPEKALKAYTDFASQYEKIKSNCIDSPKIDTRTQQIKKDKLDK